jgi:ubiquinone/menaquinone biosynthesis C-methylase UbiE
MRQLKRNVLTKGKMTEDFYDRLEPKVFKMVAERIKGSKRIIELGCGNCKLANSLAKKIGCTVVGVDITAAGFSKGKRESRRLKLSHLVNCIKGNAEYLSSFLTEKFDVCISLYVLHELENPLKVLKEVRKVLKQNGEIILIDFPKDSIAEDKWYEKFYPPNKMALFLKKSHFKNVNIEFLGGKELVYLIGKK